MSKKFNKEDIEFILDKINGWEGDLTWVSLCDSVEEHFGKKNNETGSFKTYSNSLCISAEKEN